MAYKIPFTKEQKDKLSEIGSKKKIQKAGSVLAYIIKYANKETGYLDVSIERLHAKYAENKKKIVNGKKKAQISLTYFKKLADMLVDKGILSIKREGKLKFYGINPVLDEEKQENDTEEEVQDDPNDEGLLERLAKAYKGVEYNVIATKKQLKIIAKALLVANNLNSNSVHDKCVQWLVFKKIKNSLQRINLVGAIRYIETILYEKLIEVQDDNFNVPMWLYNNIDLPKVNFTQREYLHDEYEKWEKEWQEDLWNGTALI
ncbi:TPA: hypothetical protein ACOTGW_002655 [Clostridium perfringens]|uniref:Uncharacterized protein n=3 Tax=Clostridium perfringens TaxID=1502 RepID=A0A2X3E8U1_CLOPF|nr:hypothetical protein [Clostridium perfringens]EGT4141359.1 hypothetical protein [Clostridium perfringens]MBO3431021.1 hypothetical protein [Clostridium perfringens]MDK0802297.1 hypothetical protein [Clostridium perfringens]MDM0718333.1 hypothetical protein [Clostridium perfringens]PWX48111.1 hypothetical protein CYK72_07950 [Clostridium perfringens]